MKPVSHIIIKKINALKFRDAFKVRTLANYTDSRQILNIVEVFEDDSYALRSYYAGNTMNLKP